MSIVGVDDLYDYKHHWLVYFAFVTNYCRVISSYRTVYLVSCRIMSRFQDKISLITFTGNDRMVVYRVWPARLIRSSFVIGRSKSVIYSDHYQVIIPNSRSLIDHLHWSSLCDHYLISFYRWKFTRFKAKPVITVIKPVLLSWTGRIITTWILRTRIKIQDEFLVNWIASHLQQCVIVS